jgi:lambda family phage tail tape measure protein
MTQTRAGMAQLGDSTDKTALSMELLGKANNTLNFEKVNAEVAKNKQLMEELAPFIKAQGDLYDNLHKIGVEFANEMTKETGGLVQMFVELTANTKQIAESLATLTKILGVALASWLIFSKVLPAITFAMNALQASLLATAGGGLAAIGKAFGGIVRSGTALITMTGKITAGVLAVGGTVTIITRLQQAFFSLMALMAGVLRVGLRFLGIAGIIYTVVEALDLFVDKILGMGSPLKWLGDQLGGIWEGFKKLTGMTPSVPALPDVQRGRPTMENDPRRTDAPATTDITNTNLKLQKSIQDITKAYRDQALIRVSQLQDEFRYMGMSENAVELEKNKVTILQHQKDALADLANKEQEIVNDTERTKESKRTLLGIIEQQRQAVNIVAQAETQQSEIAIANIQKQRLEQVKLNNTLEITKVAMDNQAALKNLNSQLSIVGLYGDALETANIQLQVQQELQARLLEIDKQRLDLINKKTTLTAEQYAEESKKLDLLTEQANLYATARLTGENKLIAAQRTSSRDDVAGAIGKRMEELQRSIDPTVLAVKQLDSVFSNMDSAIDNFVETGKFKFSDFASSVIKDLLKIELKAQATKLMTGAFGAGGFLSSLGSLFGFANGGDPPVNKPSIVGEKGPELFIPRSAGTIIPNGASAGGGGVVNKTYITNNISAIDSKSVAQLFAENRKMLLGTVQLAQKELPYGNR